MTVKDIVLEYLETHGFDGLVNPDAECGCGKDDLVPCGNLGEDCEGGHHWACPPKKRDCLMTYEFGCDWYPDGCYRTTKAGGGGRDMRTREYEFEGVMYRWALRRPSGEVVHQMAGRPPDGHWYPASIPLVPAAASALAVLIEDMRVIAEWKHEGLKWRARDTPSGPVVEWWRSGAEDWSKSGEATSTFRVGYEAGKTAR